MRSLFRPPRDLSRGQVFLEKATSVGSLTNERKKTATPGHVFVSDSSVTVGLNSVLKSYIKRRLDCVEGERCELYSSARMHVHACSYILAIWKCQNIHLF